MRCVDLTLILRGEPDKVRKRRWNDFIRCVYLDCILDCANQDHEYLRHEKQYLERIAFWSGVRLLDQIEGSRECESTIDHQPFAPYCWHIACKCHAGIVRAAP